MLKLNEMFVNQTLIKVMLTATSYGGSWFNLFSITAF